MSEFRFTTKDAIHVHTYLESAQISVFSVLNKKGEVISMNPAYCEKEEYHIRRVQHDFNANNVIIPDSSGNSICDLWEESKVKFFVGLFVLILITPFLILLALMRSEGNGDE